jgi:ParB-like chromosome segregation protein Spo0J
MKTTVKPENLKTPHWRTTYILRPDLTGLIESIRTFGIMYPIIAMEDGTIIDGYARWVAAHKLELSEVPVVFKDCNKIEAILLHIQLNRSRGQVTPYKLSKAIRSLSLAMDEREILNALNLTPDEFDILIDGTLIKKRKVKDHNYNKAWIPIESNATDDFQIERPPTPDA